MKQLKCKTRWNNQEKQKQGADEQYLRRHRLGLTKF